MIMNRPQTTRLAAMGLCISLLSLVWMLLVSLMFSSKHAALNLSLPMAEPIVMAKAVRHHAHKVLIAKSVPDTNTLALHTFQQQYTYVFTGQVTCGKSPCRKADVQIQIQTDKNPGIVKEASIEADGSYMAIVLFKEVPHEQIDWKIRADSKDSEAQEVHGRQILEDDPNVVVEEPIRLL